MAGLGVKPRHEQAVEAYMAECVRALGRLASAMEGENGGRGGQAVAAAAAMAAGVLELPTYRVEGGWAFQPCVHNSPCDGRVFAPRNPKKGRHDAFCLGAVVICHAWKKPRRVLGPWREG